MKKQHCYVIKDSKRGWYCSSDITDFTKNFLKADFLTREEVSGKINMISRWGGYKVKIESVLIQVVQ